MNRMISRVMTGCFAILVMLVLDIRVVSAESPPHIIFVMADDMGWG